MTGGKAKAVMMESKLPNSVLSKVWSLADTDRDGLLSLPEFCLAMYLIDIKLAGHDLRVEGSQRGEGCLRLPQQRGAREARAPLVQKDAAHTLLVAHRHRHAVVGLDVGAAGAVEIAIACQALPQQQIPGTVGCRQPEEAGQCCLSVESQNISGDYLLCSNSGFGGINGVVILQGAK